MLFTRFFSLVFIIAFLGQASAQNVLLSEDFENGLPAGWTQQNNPSSDGWLLGTNTQLQSEYWDITDHGNIIATNDDECDCNKSADYLIMPVFNLNTVTGAILQFENYFDGGSLFGGTEIPPLNTPSMVAMIGRYSKQLSVRMMICGIPRRSTYRPLQGIQIFSLPSDTMTITNGYSAGQLMTCWFTSLQGSMLS